MLVKEVMSTDVLAITPDAPVSAAARLLRRGNVGAVPVTAGNGRLCGVLTDRDIVLRCVAAGKQPEETPVRDIMTRRVKSVGPGEEVDAAARLMGLEQVRRLPVVEDGKLVGLLSLGDLSVNRNLKMEASACLSEISRNVTRR